MTEFLTLDFLTSDFLPNGKNANVVPVHKIGDKQIMDLVLPICRNNFEC